MLAVCHISDALITQIPADEELLCGNAAVYAVIIITITLATQTRSVSCLHYKLTILTP